MDLDPLEENDEGDFEGCQINLSELRVDYREVSDEVQQLRLESAKSNVDVEIENEPDFSWEENSKSESQDFENETREDGRVEKAISKMEDLEGAIQELDKEVQGATNERLQCQIQNRVHLKKLLDSNPPEAGKLAANTAQFFKLCSVNVDLSLEPDNSISQNVNKSVKKERQLERPKTVNKENAKKLEKKPVKDKNMNLINSRGQVRDFKKALLINSHLINISRCYLDSG
ncbi:uncharacterized protein LOC111674099 [Orussus abietinus]|uniref:uncharacterized protein LOC111674099 n=1 Tax=Orussus abietinus TaxID=222816 RepID=UPI000C715C6C|nr:uncharacterized protein LOC111674099 [Orussus abietinus]